MAKLIELLGHEPVSPEEAKMQCYIDPTDIEAVDDIILARLAKAAREMAENYTWYAYVYGRYEHTMRGFPEGEFEIPTPPLHEIESITYQTQSGEQTLDPSLYYVDAASEPGLIGPVFEWPFTLNRSGSVKVTYKAGYKSEPAEGDPPGIIVPDQVKSAMLIIVKFLFDYRDTIMPERTTPLRIPSAAMVMLDPYTLQRYV